MWKSFPNQAASNLVRSTFPFTFLTKLKSKLKTSLSTSWVDAVVSSLDLTSPCNSPFKFLFRLWANGQGYCPLCVPSLKIASMRGRSYPLWALYHPSFCPWAHPSKSLFPFLPLHDDFDHNDANKWKWLVNVLQEYLLDPHLHTKFQSCYLFTRELFWMAFIAAYPTFPHSPWPLWNSEIAREGDFVSR